MPNFISNTIQVHIAAFFENDVKFLLLKRASHLKTYPNIWQVITGTIEKGETALNCALREIEEETGIIARDIWTIPYITQFFDSKRDLIHSSPVFGVIVQSNIEINISDEHQDFLWLSITEAEDKLVLPTHIEAMKIFNRYTLQQKDKSLFKISESLLKSR